MRIAILLTILINVAASAQGVGDIAFDPNTDDPKFQLCNAERVAQSYQLRTPMDETSIMVDKEIRSRFKTNDAWKNENGMIRVRFVVNCSGVADRFRLLEMSFDLKEKQFNPELRSHILAIAKSIQWPARRARQQTVDYYDHFSVRIVNGHLIDIVQ